MISLFLVEAPFQLVSAMRAATSIGGENCVLVVRETGRTRNDLQLERILASSGFLWAKIVRVDTRNRFRAVLQLLSYKLSLVISHTMIRTVAYGDYRSSFNRVFHQFF